MRLRLLFCAITLASLAGCAALLGFDDASEAPTDSDGGEGGGVSPEAGGGGDAPPSNGPPVDCGAPLGTSDNCAACGHTCLGAVCQNGACAAIPVKTGLTNPQGIALDTDSVFVALNFDNDILRIDKSGATFTGLTKPNAGGLPRAVAIDAERVFWASYQTNVRACPLTGCTGAATQYQANSPGLLLLDGDRLVFADNDGIRSRDKNDGSAPLTLTPDVSVRAIQSDGTYIYATDTLDQRIIRVPLLGGTTDPLASTSKVPSGIALTSTKLYYGEAQGAVVSIPIGGGSPTPFGAPTISAAGLTTDGTFLYWADEGDLDAQGLRKPDGCIRACPLATCETVAPIDLACGQAGATDIAVDDQAVYWTNFGITAPSGNPLIVNAGSVMKVAKPPAPH